MASGTRSTEAKCVAGGPCPVGIESCSPRVQETIIAARSPGTRLMYDNRWKLFSQWCAERNEDPRRCSIQVILAYLQSLFDKGRAPGTLKVYVAAISLYHETVGEQTVGSHRSVSQFLRGTRRLRPRRPNLTLNWDLKLVLDSLCRPPYEPINSIDLKWLSLKTAFLLAITSAKRVSELHALSVSSTCMRWLPGESAVKLWPNAAFLPKVLKQTYANKPLVVAQYHPGDGELQAREELCPVRALKAYVSATQEVRHSTQLFVCYGSEKRGQHLSKQRLSHWITEVIQRAYTTAGDLPPPGIKAHSARAMAASWAAMRGVPLEDICAAADWTTPNTFTRFYRVNVADPSPLSTAVLHH